MSRETPRYMLDSRLNNDLLGMEISRVESARGLSPMNMPSGETPFNPSLSIDVDYSLKNSSPVKSRVLTKYENMSNGDNNNIALYDPRQELDDYTKLKMAKELKTVAESRVRLQQLQGTHDLNGVPFAASPASHHDSQFNGNANGNANGWSYNPNLPESETNVRPKNKPHAVDIRAHRNTTEREWNYESDRAKIAYDLQRSEHIRDRNEAQKQADAALFNRAYNDRYVESRQPYRGRTDTRGYTIENNTSGAPSRRSFKDHPEAFVNTRKLDSSKYVADGYDKEYTSAWNKELGKTYDQQMQNSRIEGFSKRYVENGASYIADTIKTFFGWGPVRETYDSDKDMHRRKLDVENFKEAIINSDVGNDFNVGLTSRDYYKPNHMMVVKNGDLVESYPETEYNNVAAANVTSDVDTGLTRSVALFTDDKLLFVQERAANAIFDGDNMAIGDDVLVTEIPVEALDTSMREHIRAKRMGTNRDKVVELTYEEFEALSDYVANDPSLQHRESRQQLHSRTRTSDYDKSIIENFDGHTTFVDETVVTGVANGARKRAFNHTKGRVEKQYSEEFVEGVAQTTPMTTDRHVTSSKTSSMNRTNGATYGSRKSEKYRKH